MGRWEPGVPQPEGKWPGKDYPKRRHEAQGEGRDPGPGPQTRGNARAKAAHQAEMSAVSKGRREGGDAWRGPQGTSSRAVWARAETVRIVAVLRAPEWEARSFHHFLSSVYTPGPFQVLAESTTGTRVLGLETDVK